MSKTNYSVATQNRFADLGSDDDSDSNAAVTNKNAKQQQSVRKSIKQTNASPDPSNTESQHNKPQRSEKKPQLNNSSNTGRSRQQHQQKSQGEANESMPNIQVSFEDHTVHEFDKRSRVQRSSNTTNTRGSRNGFSDQRHPRTFNRHSGTGRGKEMKKSGGGAHNWGNETADFGGEVERQIKEKENKSEEDVIPVQPEEKIVNHSESSPSPQINEKPAQEKFLNYSEYQRAQKIKRANLLQEGTPEAAQIRNVDETELEAAGFEKYERDETAEERAARELHMMQGVINRDEDSEEEHCHRPKTYNLSEFTGSLTSRGRSSRGRGRSGRDSYRVTNETRVSKQADPVSLDLTDSAAFPSLT